MSNYPYTSAQSAVVQTFEQLRKGFPAKVDASYLQKFSIAPANESYIIAILRFLGLIDDEGNKVEAKSEMFYGNDDAFRAGLDGLLREAYKKVFAEMGDSALASTRDELTNWFRVEDKTSDTVGRRQALTFQTLVGLAGHTELPVTPKKPTQLKKGGAGPVTPAAPKGKVVPAGGQPPKVEKGAVQRDVGLTVRIEVNLPAGGDAATYDAIFASIKTHLMS